MVWALSKKFVVLHFVCMVCVVLWSLCIGIVDFVPFNAPVLVLLAFWQQQNSREKNRENKVK